MSDMQTCSIQTPDGVLTGTVIRQYKSKTRVMVDGRSAEESFDNALVTLTNAPAQPPVLAEPAPIAALVSAPTLTAKIPDFTIAERRAKYGTAIEQSIPDPLPLQGQPEKMVTRGFNRDMWSGRIYQASNGGWVKVSARELEVPAPDLGLTEQPDGSVTAGDKGEVIYFKMPKRLYDQIQRAKAERRRTKRNSESARKQVQQSALGAAAMQAREQGDVDGAIQLEKVSGKLDAFHTTEFKESTSGQPTLD